MGIIMQVSSILRRSLVNQRSAVFAQMAQKRFHGGLKD